MFKLRVCDTLPHKSNLLYAGFFKNFYFILFFEKLEIMEKTCLS